MGAWLRSGGSGVPPLEPRAEPRVGRPAFLRPVPLPWVNRCLGILDVLSAPPRNNPHPHPKLAPAVVWRPPFPHLRQQNRLMDRGARPEAWAEGRRRPAGSRQRAGPSLGGSWRGGNRGRCGSASCLLSFLPFCRSSSAPSLFGPLSAIYGLSAPPHSPAASMQTPSAQSLPLRDRNTSWQLRRNSSLQRPLSLHSASHPIPSWPPARPQ